MMTIDRAIQWVIYNGDTHPTPTTTGGRWHISAARWRAMVNHIRREYGLS